MSSLQSDTWLHYYTACAAVCGTLGTSTITNCCCFLEALPILGQKLERGLVNTKQGFHNVLKVLHLKSSAISTAVLSVTLDWCSVHGSSLIAYCGYLKQYIKTTLVSCIIFYAVLNKTVQCWTWQFFVQPLIMLKSNSYIYLQGDSFISASMTREGNCSIS